MRTKIGGALFVSAAVVSTMLVGVQPSYAALGTVSASGAVVTVTGTDAGDAIDVQSIESGRRIEVRAGPDFSPGTGCTFDDDPTTHRIICELESAGRVNIDAGGGGDVVRVGQDSSPNTQVVTRGGPGDDAMFGGPAIEEWFGEDGNDMLTPDLAFEESQVGPDLVRGGPGQDQVNLGGYLGGVSVTLDDQPNDTNSAGSALDDIGSDVEILRGTERDDFLTGNDLSQVFDAGLGNDTIVALGGDDVVGGHQGNDRIEGGPGDDQLYGSDGDDTIDGGAGKDTLFGESENDTLTGGPGVDSINGDSGDPLVTGNDTIHAVDGEQDMVACGPGGDTANVDSTDVVSAQGQDTCETVAVTPALPPPPATSPTPPPATPPPSASAAELLGKVLRANKRRAAVAIGCTGVTQACAGKVTIKKRGVVLARGRYTVAAGSKEKVTVKLTRSGRSALRRSASVRVVVRLVAANGEVTKRRYKLKRG